jgi:hypothetical protein
MAARDDDGGKAREIEEANRQISRPDAADRGSDTRKRLDRSSRPERAMTTRPRAPAHRTTGRERRRQD